MNIFLQNILNPKTIKKLGRAARKFIAGVTIIMSVFYGTLYYALITLASEDDNVPKPLVAQAFNSENEPQKFYLESVANKSDKIAREASPSADNYNAFIIGANKVIEPLPTAIKNKLYVPFRLIIASGSRDLEVELKSKKGIQKIVWQNGGFDYAIFEKQKKNFTKLADVKNIFQFSNLKLEPTVFESPVPSPEPSVIEPPLITVEPPPTETPIPQQTETAVPSPEITPEIIPVITPETTPELSPQSFFQKLFNTANAVDATEAATQNWQDVIFSNPVSASWAIDGQLLTFNQENEFYLGTVSFSAWARIKLGIEDSKRINSWEYGVTRSDGLAVGDYSFRLKYDAKLAADIKAKNEEAGELELTVEKDEDKSSQEISDIESEITETEELQTNEPSQTPSSSPIIEEEGITPSPSQSPNPLPAEVEPPTSAASPSETIIPAPELGSETSGTSGSGSEAATGSSTTGEVTPVPEEPVTTPHFEITPIPTETVEPTPEATSLPSVEPTPTTTEPTSLNDLLNELLGIKTVYADESPVTEPVPIPNVVPTDNAESKSDEIQSQNNESETENADINTETNNLKAELPSDDEQMGVTPGATEVQATDPLVEGVGNIVDTITNRINSFVNNPSISAPAIEDTNLVVEPPSEQPQDEKQPDETDLSEQSLPPPPLTAQIIDAISALNLLPQAEKFDFKLNFNFGPAKANNIALDEKTGHLTALLELESSQDVNLWSSQDQRSCDDPTICTTSNVVQPVTNLVSSQDTISATTAVLTTISDIGVSVYDDGIWVASGDGSKSTDFKIHFNPAYGGAVDELFLGSDFTNNKVTRPQAGSGGLTLIEQDGFSQADNKSLTLEVLEQSKVLVVVRNIFVLGHGNGGGREAEIEERWAIYATGRIVKQVIYDKLKTGEERWYLNAAKSGFDLPAGYNGTQLMLNTKVEPNSKDIMLVWQDPSSMASATFEINTSTTSQVVDGGLLQDNIGSSQNLRSCDDNRCDSWITVVKSTRKPWTYTERQMIDLMQEDLSVIDKTMIDERTADYRQPDKLELSVGSFIGVNDQFFSYEMRSPEHKNRVVFKMDGSQTPRFQPVFEIQNWLNPDLSAIRSYMNQKNMIENRDYIVDFRNGDPSTGILVFHFLGTLRANSEFSADGFGIFDIDPEVAPGGGVLVYGEGDGRNGQSTITTNSTGHVMGAFASISISGNGNLQNPFWIVNRASPIGGSQASGSDNEHLVGSLNGTGSLSMDRWNGTAWTRDWTELNVGSQSLDTRAFDIAYETSGEAIAVWSSMSSTGVGGTTGKLEYRVWNGISWEASASFAIPTTQRVTWIEMASHPASGSNQNEIGMCYVTGGLPVAPNGTLVGCAIWNGTTNTWGNTKFLESNAEENGAVTGTTKTVADFYEQSSGKFIAVWGVEGTANSDNVPVLASSSWMGSDAVPAWTATTSFGSAEALSGAAGPDSATTLVCSPAPFSINSITAAANRAVCIGHDDESVDAWAFVWDANGANAGLSNITGGVSTSADAKLLDLDINAVAAANARVPVAASWLIDGSNRVGIIAWGSSDTTTVNYNGWNDGGSAWLVAGGNPGGSTFTTGTTGTDNNYVFAQNNSASGPNPYQKNTAMLFLVDSNKDLFAYEASVSGTTVAFSQLNGGVAITADMGTANGLPIGMSYDIFPNPTQIHYQWVNDDSATVAGGTSAASEDTQLTGLAESTVKVLRVEISNEGTATISDNFQLEFAKKGTGCTEPTLSAGWRYREIHTAPVTASDAFDIENAQWANGDATADGDTVSLTNEDTTFVAGQAIDTQSSTSAIQLNGNQFTEVVFAIQRNSNAQQSTNYCFRITDGGSSTSYTYQRYAEVQTSGAAAPTYTQDFFRFYVNANVLTPTDPWPADPGAGAVDLAENATMSAHFASVASGSIMRVRTNTLVSTATLNAASQTFQFQYAEGFKCGAIAGGSWTAVGASTSDTIWRFGSNAGVTDGTTLADGGTLLSNSTNAARATYEEGNPSAVNPNAVTSGQRMEHDWSVQNNGAVSGASYCFRIIRPSGTVFETYNRFPLVILAPSTDQVLRHGTFFSEGYEQGYYWAGI